MQISRFQQDSGCCIRMFRSYIFIGHTDLKFNAMYVQIMSLKKHDSGVLIMRKGRKGYYTLNAANFSKI